MLNNDKWEGLDFRSDEAIELLKQADIVITNPPFSLFENYIKLLVKYNKKFLIIGNFNAVKYKYVFPLIKENKLWVGTLPFCRGMLFNVNDPQELISGRPSGYKIVDGVAKAIISATWFTNLEHNQRKFLPLTKTYNPQDYPKYDNADVINVNDKRHIPKDYYGIMGVPTTFIDKYHPDQFVILGLDRELTDDKHSATLCGRRLYTRIFIQRRDKKSCKNRIKSLFCFLKGKFIPC